LIALAVTAMVAMAISGLIAASKIVAFWINMTRYDTESFALTWANSVAVSATEAFFAMLAGATALAAVLSRNGRRPFYIGLLVVAALACGFALSDSVYLIVAKLVRQ
jgi:hypothetical protein